MMLCKTGKVKDIKKYHLKGWIAQEKKDGVRCLVYCDEEVKLIGRSGNDYTSKFPEIAEDLKGLKCVLDGEICCDTFNKTSSRVHTENKLKLKILRQNYPAVFFVFDIISLNGENLMSKPLKERLKLLYKNIQDKQSVKKLGFTFDLVKSWEICKIKNHEGIILKRIESRYSNNRSWDWIKIKKEITKDIIVDSYTLNPAGIRVEGELACQITGSNAKLVKKEIDETGSCKIEVKGLEITKNNKIRQIVFKSIK